MSQRGSLGIHIVRRGGSAPPGHPAAEILADLDTQLMLQARTGNREAANALIRRNSERITRYIARLVGDSAAEDLTQDVFLQAFSHASTYQATARVLTWLYRIATNVALNHLRQQASARRAAASSEDEPLDVPDPAELTPERQVTIEELRQQVTDAVNGLPLNQRIALTLFEYEDCSYEQIAAVLDVTVEAVRSLLGRARTTLRGRLRGAM